MRFLFHHKSILGLLVFACAMLGSFFIANGIRFALSPDQELTAEFQNCLSRLNQLDAIKCVGSHAQAWIARYGAVPTSHELDIYENSSGSSFTCHLAGHQIGKAILQASGNNLMSALLSCTPGCHSSCLHGVFLEYGMQMGGSAVQELLAMHPTEECARLGVAGGSPLPCAHGLGHAFAIGENYALPKALADCGRLSDPALSFECYTGVYMELNNAADGFSDARIPVIFPPKEKDPYYPCSLPETLSNANYARACFQQKSPALFSYANEQGVSLFALCKGAPGGWESPCVQGIGYVFASHGESFGAIGAFCQKARNNGLKNTCLYGAYYFLRGTQNGISQIAQFCAELASAQQDICRKGYAPALSDQ